MLNKYLLDERMHMALMQFGEEPLGTSQSLRRKENTLEHLQKVYEPLAPTIFVPFCAVGIISVPQL